MHRTLKEETASPPKSSWRAQQRAFDRFRKEYNEERPHDALQGKVPASVYVGSMQKLPTRTAHVDYPFGEYVMQVDKAGDVRLGRRKVHITPVLAGERVLFERLDEKCWEVYFGRLLLGFFDASQKGPNLTQPKNNWRKVSAM